ncbi:cytochrome c oxidase assembly protein [Mycolicibacterium sp. OfavD-34-C]|uniref:cytochrome c oxidase assembly protein n=1 Tax=Mycolicibacterium sp. OfavD-34-C TaxID=2917746 RepID=UPI001EF4EF19|nr:cytochrome c oxidase assembly protein [Mycolicibacterium sp. OfavD-34-C]MCG7579905.1 cytochrome c oxidase assembly protein [Mycolicibacterium sp. OfavD-34-C]
MQTTRADRPATARQTLAPVLLSFAAVSAALLWYAATSRAEVYAVTGNSYPGTVTAVAEPLGFFVASLLGALSIGGLAFVVITARPDTSGVIDERSFLVHVLLERTAALWAVTATAMIVIQAASDAGVPMRQVLAGPFLLDAVLASEMARAWIAVAIAAAVVAITVRLSVRWTAHAVLLIPALIGVVAVPVNGNAAQGPDHDYATSAAIVFAAALAVLAGLWLVSALTRPDEAALRRVVVVRTALGAVVLGYGAALLGVLLGPAGPTGSAYGRAGTAAALLLMLMWALDVVVVSRRGPSGLSRVAGVFGAAGALAVMALVAVMATQPAARFLTHDFTTWDIFLGYELPQPPGVGTLLTVWRFDTFLGAGALVLAALYTLGYVRLRRRGDAWPVGRLIAWLAGCLVLLFVSSSGVKAYGSAMFSVHMAEHMTLNMFVPVLLVLGGPVTLALRALPAHRPDQPPGPREWLLWLVHSKFTSFLAHPITAFVLFVGSLYAVYFTPLFDALARYHWGHEFMSLHFLLVGYLFFWGIIGIDPGPRKLPFLGRLGLLFAVMPFHAFFGIATMTMTEIIGGQFYRSVDLPWLASLADDQNLGGAIAWGSSEVPVVLVVVALVAQWARQDRRTATRSDRHADSSYADDELEAYNAMLRELARQRQ